MRTERCTKCNSDELPLSDNLNYKDMCIACECQEIHEQWEKDVDAELERYNSENGTDHDFNSFYNASYDGKINLHTVTGFEELKECFHAALSDKSQAEFEAALPPNDPRNTSLPF